MVVSPTKGANIIEAHERMINDTLMQLACRPPHSFSRPNRHDLIDVLEEIADLRFGAEPSYGRSAGFYSGPLYWDVFAADPLGNTRYRLERLRKRHHNIWIDCDCQKMTDALRKFHTAFADGCQEQEMGRMAIMLLLDEFTAALHA